jgi:threonine aldolase
MAEAEVGDDVYGDDPTVRALQDEVAELLGTEAALFMPSGTMANEVALRAHTEPGDAILIGHEAHCWLHESGALAALAGCQTQPLPGDGRFTAAAVRAAFQPAEFHLSPSRVLAVENTHNWGGGLIWDRAALTEVTTTAHELGLRTHLDGARLWNAAIASGASERELAVGFDSISVCLSKGLGAPVGSLIAGGRAFISRCHRFRKMYGGGMRQAGILAAAGRHALAHHRARLAVDHAHARLLADELAGAPGLTLDAARVQTNIVMIDLTGPAADAKSAVAAARAEGVLLGVAGPRRIRAVTHLDVDRDDVLRAVAVVRRVVAGA